MFSIGKSTSSLSLFEYVAQLLKNKVVEQPLIKYSSNDMIQDTSTLKSRCIQVLVKKFSRQPFHLNDAQKIAYKKNKNDISLTSDITKQIAQELSTSLELDIAIRYIHDDNYWKRKSVEAFGLENCYVKEHGLLWKRLFLERHLQQLLESNDTKNKDIDSLLKKV